MKKLFVLAVLMIVSVIAPVTQAEVQVSDLSQGSSPFRPSLEEMRNGIQFLGAGVYRFDRRGGGLNSIQREFGPMLAAFKIAHADLELESATPEKMDKVGDEIRITSYIVSFRVKK